jgi:hypothetical protein
MYEQVYRGSFVVYDRAHSLDISTSLMITEWPARCIWGRSVYSYLNKVSLLSPQTNSQSRRRRASFSSLSLLSLFSLMRY